MIDSKYINHNYNNDNNNNNNVLKCNNTIVTTQIWYLETQKKREYKKRKNCGKKQVV